MNGADTEFLAARARALFEESLALHQKLGVKRGVGECLVGLAAVIGAEGQPDEAIRLLAAGEAQFAALGTGPWPADKADLERHLARLKTHFDEAAFRALDAQGRALSLEEAIARAVQGR